MRLSSLSDIGIKRKDNQDNYWSARFTVDGVEGGVVCVCDGMGGLDDGALASRIVVETIREHFMRSADVVDLDADISMANSKIRNISLQNQTKMGTTCTLVYCIGGRYVIKHVGDSRCYLLRGNSMTRLTTDHSAIEKFKISKEKSPDLYKKYRNSLTRCIGIEDRVVVDTYEGSYSAGDAFFCCSDGLWHYLEDLPDVSIETFRDLKKLIANCISYGETDNITVSVLEVGEEDERN